MTRLISILVFYIHVIAIKYLSKCKRHLSYVYRALEKRYKPLFIVFRRNIATCC